MDGSDTTQRQQPAVRVIDRTQSAHAAAHHAADTPRRLGGQSDGFTLVLKRVFPADRAVVVGAFLNPNELARWFGPKGYSVARVDFTFRVGDRYRIEMQPPEGGSFHIAGEVIEVDVPRRLAFTFVYEEPHADDVETRVTLSFRDLAESTEVDFTQGPFKTAARRALHQDGWNDSFDRLELRISAQA